MSHQERTEIGAKSMNQDLDGMDIKFFCCYCAEPFDTERMMWKHEIRCKLGPELLIQLTLDKMMENLCKTLQVSPEHSKGQEKVLDDRYCSVDIHYFCCYCAESFDTEEIMRKHEVQCHFGPELLIQLTLDKMLEDMLHAGQESSGNGTKVDQSSNESCPSTLKAKRDRGRHQKLCSCKHCLHSTNYKHNLIRHNMLIHKIKKRVEIENEMNCANCDYSTKYRWRLVRHMRIHKEITKKLLSCANCDFSTNYRPSLVQHILIHNKGKLPVIVSHICNYKTDNRIYLKRNLRRKHSENSKMYPCIGCDKKFKYKNALDEHIVKNHKNLVGYLSSKLHRCRKCTYRSVLKYRVTQHYRSQHQKVTAVNDPCYKCSTCQYVTNTKRYYSQHLKIHTKNYKCSFCVKGFATKYQFQMHIVKNHSGNDQLMKKVTTKVYKCSHCDYITGYRRNFQRHSEKHNKFSEC